MPPAPKTNKKPGAPKAKGAVRAKSGCYTCRIRRKKCDERPNEKGECETCVRLRLQCLGFGAKRPDWLRESSRVGDLREKIKTFLASNGMIKGHSAAGARTADNEPIILHLSDNEFTPSSSESPPNQMLSLPASDGDGYRQPTHNTSALRETWGDSPRSQYQLLPARHYGSPYSRPVSPYSGGSNGYNDIYSYSSANHHQSNSLVPWNIRSSFGHSYHLPGGVFEDGDFNDYSTSSEHTTYSFTSPIFTGIDELTEHYMKTVAYMQYMLAEKSEFNIIFQVSLDGHPREAARLLASVHCQRDQIQGVPALQSTEAKARYEKLEQILNQDIFDHNDAMAALHVISSFLFDGGHGEWQKWLMVACRYCRTVFQEYGGDPIQTLLQCSSRERLLIKITIWFDVLASVSTLQPPHFMDVISVFCAPVDAISGLYDPTAPTTLPELSMMSSMGCENVVVWALAKTSELAAWKDQQSNRGRLSIPQLVEKGSVIENYLNSAAPGSAPIIASDADPVVDASRQYTSEIFHSAAKVYLRSVISGDHPSVPEIRVAVSETIGKFQDLNGATREVQAAVVRSTVFALFICGCLTDDPSMQAAIRAYTQHQNGVGNCSSVTKMLDGIWSARSAAPPKEPVPWRKRLHEVKLLLV